MAAKKVINMQDKRAAMLKAREASNARTFDVELVDASAEIGEPFIAKVRRFAMGERIAYYGAPQHLEDRIVQATKAYARLLAKNQVAVQTDGTVNENTMMANMMLISQEADFEEMVNVVCLAVAVTPALVETEEDLEINTDAWLITDISFGDRMRIFSAAQAA